MPDEISYDFWPAAVPLEVVRARYQGLATLESIWPWSIIEKSHGRPPFGIHPLARFGKGLLAQIDANLSHLAASEPDLVRRIAKDNKTSKSLDMLGFWSALAELQTADCLISAGCRPRQRGEAGPDFPMSFEGFDFELETKTLVQRHSRMQELEEVEHHLNQAAVRDRLCLQLPETARLVLQRKQWHCLPPSDFLVADREVVQLTSRIHDQLRNPEILRSVAGQWRTDLGLEAEDLEIWVRNRAFRPRGSRNAHWDAEDFLVRYVASALVRMADGGKRGWKKQLATGRPTTFVVHSIRNVETDMALAHSARHFTGSSKQIARIDWDRLIAHWQERSSRQFEHSKGDIVGSLESLYNDPDVILDGVLFVTQGINERMPYRGIWVRGNPAPSERLEAALANLLGAAEC